MNWYIAFLYVNILVSTWMLLSIVFLLTTDYKDLFNDDLILLALLIADIALFEMQRRSKRQEE